MAADGKYDYYVYDLIDPRSMKTFYVGKGRGARPLSHEKQVRRWIDRDRVDVVQNLRKFETIAEIVECGLSVECRVIKRFKTAKEAIEAERARIAKLPGLTNAGPGRPRKGRTARGDYAPRRTVRMTVDDLALFTRAAKKRRKKLSTWMLEACRAVARSDLE